MSLMALMGKGLSSPEDADDAEEGAEGDDTDLAELGAKYGSRLAEAIEAKDGAGVYKALCKLIELHSYEEREY